MFKKSRLFSTMVFLMFLTIGGTAFANGPWVEENPNAYRPPYPYWNQGPWYPGPYPPPHHHHHHYRHYY